jgi:hypothetical protein
MVEFIADEVEFVAVKAGTLPEPEATNPIAVLLFVQVKVVPEVLELKEVSLTVVPSQCI